MHYLGEVENIHNTLWQIYNNKCNILSESAWFCRQRDKKHLVCFWDRSSNCCSLTKRASYVSQGSVAPLIRWAGKHLNYCITKLFKTMYTKFYQNWQTFVKDMTKTFCCVFFGSQCSYCVQHLMCRVFNYSNSVLNVSHVVC